jgi:hypothetical protein
MFLPLVSLTFLPAFSVSAADAGMRPALIGNGPQALVNQIDTKKLIARGSKDAAIYFSCAVSAKGGASAVITYRGTSDSKALAQAVKAAMPHSRFIPALYNGKPVDVWFSGMVFFFIMDGKPKLRVYAHQDQDDIAKGVDFVAPQLILGTENWKIAKTELEAARLARQNGAVELEISVDAEGKNQGMKVISEDPPNFNFGHAALTDYKNALFIPGFRNGQLGSCSFRFTDYVSTYARLDADPLNPTHIGPQ